MSNLLRGKSLGTFSGWRRGHRGREIAVRGEDSGLSLGEQRMWWLGRERWAERGTEKAGMDGEGGPQQGFLEPREEWAQGGAAVSEESPGTPSSLWGCHLLHLLGSLPQP